MVQAAPLPAGWRAHPRPALRPAAAREDASPVSRRLVSGRCEVEVLQMAEARARTYSTL